MKYDLLIIDGKGLLWRTTDAFKTLSVEIDGEDIPTGGVFGFLSTSIRIHPKYGGKLVVAWEGRSNFRQKLFPSYKGRDQPLDDERQEMILEMVRQEKILIEVLSDLGISQYRGKGCEADDVIGRLATEAADRGLNVAIYSGDSDLRQLVCERIKVVASSPKGDVVYDEKAVQKRHGVPPRLLAQLKAMAGDSSDRIPGARGIGPVTAAVVLNKYGSLKRALEAAKVEDPEWPDSKRRREIIAQSAEEIQRYYRLTKIQTAMPYEKIKSAKNVETNKVMEHLRRLKFRSLAAAAEFLQLMRLHKKL